MISEIFPREPIHGGGGQKTNIRASRLHLFAARLGKVGEMRVAPIREEFRPRPHVWRSAPALTGIDGVAELMHCVFVATAAGYQATIRLSDTHYRACTLDILGRAVIRLIFIFARTGRIRTAVQKSYPRL